MRTWGPNPPWFPSTLPGPAEWRRFTSAAAVRAKRRVVAGTAPHQAQRKEQAFVSTSFQVTVTPARRPSSVGRLICPKWPFRMTVGDLGAESVGLKIRVSVVQCHPWPPSDFLFFDDLRSGCAAEIRWLCRICTVTWRVAGVDRQMGGSFDFAVKVAFSGAFNLPGAPPLESPSQAADVRRPLSFPFARESKGVEVADQTGSRACRVARTDARAGAGP